jgi:predicted MFS family arabinose efflux permease
MPPHVRFILWLGVALTSAGLARAGTSLCLPYLRRDLALSETEATWVAAAAATSQLLTWLVLPFVERVGARRFLLGAICALAIAAGIAALPRDLSGVLGTQIALQAAAGAVAGLAAILTLRVCPADSRSISQAVLQATGMAGPGLLALSLGAFDSDPRLWRAALALAAVLGLPAFVALRRFDARRLPSLDSIETSASSGASLGNVGLAGRLVALHVLIPFVDFPAMTYAIYHVVERLEFSGARAGSMVLVGGAFGVGTMIAAGLIADRLGARAVGVASLLLRAGALWVFYGTSRAAEPLAVVAVYAVVVGSSFVSLVCVRHAALEAVREQSQAALSGLATLASALASLGAMLLLSIWTSHQDVGRCVQLVSPLLAIAGLALATLPRVRPEATARPRGGGEGTHIADPDRRAGRRDRERGGQA